jgi:hypothetical protein
LEERKAALGSAAAAKCQTCFARLYSKVNIEATGQEVRAATRMINDNYFCRSNDN